MVLPLGSSSNPAWRRRRHGCKCPHPPQSLWWWWETTSKRPSFRPARREASDVRRCCSGSNPVSGWVVRSAMLDTNLKVNDGVDVCKRREFPQQRRRWRRRLHQQRAITQGQSGLGGKLSVNRNSSKWCHKPGETHVPARTLSKIKIKVAFFF